MPDDKAVVKIWLGFESPLKKLRFLLSLYSLAVTVRSNINRQFQAEKINIKLIGCWENLVIGFLVLFIVPFSV
ncbi:hypothetical protein AKJ16_DCAP17772 [Drosera capensis]